MKIERDDVIYYFDYPHVRQSLAVAALREAYPTLLLDPRGDICGFNLLALWLLGTLRPDEALHPEQLMGVNAFTLAARNIDRMPVEHNQEMYSKLSAIVKRSLERRFSSAYAVYKNFITAMQANPHRAQLYDSAPLHPEKEWEYPLFITHPQDSGLLLEYTVSVFRLEGNAGYLVVYYPNSSTLAVLEEMNSLLIEHYGEGDAAIFFRSDPSMDYTGGSDILSPVVHFRPYYPAFVQDPLWYLRSENEAHRLLVGTSVVGLHFFEMFFSPLVRVLLGPIQDSTAPRALKYFDLFTEPFRHESHFLHKEYTRLMDHLMQIDGFPEVLALSRRLPIHINAAAQLNLATMSEIPFYACRVLLPWPYEPDIRLQFKSMVNFIFTDEMIVRPDLRSFQDTLVPENDQTDVALMLLPLLEGQRHAWRDKPLAQQYLWLLALVKVVEEGHETREDDTTWNPRDAYQSAKHGLALRYDLAGEDDIRTIIAEIQATIEVLDRSGKLDKGKLLALLHSYTVAQPALQALSEFLKEELEVVKQP